MHIAIGSIMSKTFFTIMLSIVALAAISDLYFGSLKGDRFWIPKEVQVTFIVTDVIFFVASILLIAFLYI